MGRRGRSELSAASFVAEEAFGSKVGLGLRWLPIKTEQGDEEEERASGGESGEGEALVAPEWPGQWRRLRLPKMGKETSPGRLAANGGPLEVAWDCLRAEMSSGLLI